MYLTIGRIGKKKKVSGKKQTVLIITKVESAVQLDVHVAIVDKRQVGQKDT